MRREEIQAAQAFLMSRRALGSQPSSTALAQSSWWIDSINGSDLNPGSQAAPIKTAARYFQLTGAYRPTTSLVTISLVNDLPASDPLILSSLYLTPSAQVKVVDGNPTILASGTLTGQVSFNSTTQPSGQLQVVTDNSRATWAPFVGKVFKVTSGAAAGATATIIADLGGGSANVSVIGRTTTVNPATYSAVSIQGNESYQVLDRRSVGALIVDDLDPSAWSETQIPAVPALTLTGIRFPQVAPQNAFYFQRGLMVANDCDITGIAVLPLARLYANNCYSSNAAFTGIGVSGFLREFYGWHDGTFIFLSPPGLYSTTTSIFHACTLAFQFGGEFEAHHEIGIYNCASFLTVTDQGLIKMRHGAFGSGNTGSLIIIQNGKLITEATSSTANWPVTGTGVGYQDIKFASPAGGAAQTQLPAMDPASYTLTALRNLTFANYYATVAGGGFNQSIFDPAAPNNAMYSTGL